MTQDASETEMKKDQSNEESLTALPAEFSKNVNDYLTHHVTIADAKAGVFLAAVAVVATILIEQQFFSIVTQILLLLSLATLLLSGIAFTLVIFPRLPKGERPHLFCGLIEPDEVLPTCSDRCLGETPATAASVLLRLS